MALIEEQYLYNDETLTGTNSDDFFSLTGEGEGYNTINALAGDDNIGYLGLSPSGVTGGAGADVFSFSEIPTVGDPINHLTIIADAEPVDVFQFRMTGTPSGLYSNVSANAANKPYSVGTFQFPNSSPNDVKSVLAAEVDGDFTWDYFISLTDPSFSSFKSFNANDFSYQSLTQFDATDAVELRYAPENSIDPDASSVEYDFFSLPIAEQVTAIYLGYFGRPPESGGKNYWTQRYQEDIEAFGKTASIPNQMATEFSFSSEAINNYSFLSPDIRSSASDGQISDFVEDVFENLFNRTPGMSGIEYWTDNISSKLAGDGPIGDILIDIMAGAGGADARALTNKIDVAMAYSETVSGAGFNVDEAKEIVGQVNEFDSSVTNAINQF